MALEEGSGLRQSGAKKRSRPELSTYPQALLLLLHISIIKDIYNSSIALWITFPYPGKNETTRANIPKCLAIVISHIKMTW